MSRLFVKTEDASIRLRVDFTRRFRVGSAVWSSEVIPRKGDPLLPAPLVLSDAGHDGGASWVTVSGGEPGVRYRVVNRADPSGGRLNWWTKEFRVEVA